MSLKHIRFAAQYVSFMPKTDESESKPIKNEPQPRKFDVSKLSDFEVALLILERDISQYRVERCDELLNQVGEAKGFGETRPTVKEDTFTVLKFESVKSERLQGLEAAHKLHNVEQNWTHAYGVLKAANAVINSRYHGEGYEFTYWIYGTDRIFRQPLARRE
jgi:hypothetical protein